jgi:hypothetical protein
MKPNLSSQMSQKKHNTWKKDNMIRVLIAVRNKEIGLLRAAKIFEMSKSALENKVKATEQSTEKSVNTRIGRKLVLREDLENAIVSYCLVIKNSFWLYYQGCQENAIPTDN